MGIFQGTEERVRNRRVDEPSVFEPLKFYCSFQQDADVTGMEFQKYLYWFSAKYFDVEK